MGLSEMSRELRDVKAVPWQLTAVILGLFFGLPMTVGGVWGMLTAKGQGSSALAAIVAAPGALMLIWAAFGMRSRVKQARLAGEPAGPIARKLLVGAAVIIVTIAVVSVYAWAVEVPSFVVAGPAGFFGVVPGLVLILRAMIAPPRRVPSASAPHAAVVAPKVGAPIPTVLPPRPRMNR